MTVSVNKLRKIKEQLEEILDEAESRGATEVKTKPNTYGMNEFISCGYSGFLDLDDYIYDLFDEEE